MKKDALLKLAQQQYSAGADAMAEQMQEMEEDLRIYDGSGIWDEALRTSRVNDPKGARPCLTISDIPPRCRQIMNDVRQNKPSIKIRPVDSGADVETAEVLSGIIRHIEQNSMADIAYETANFYQTVAGVGYFRLVEAYSQDENKPELYIRPIYNPNSVVIDPYADCPVASNARYAFITEDIPRKDFEREYGDRDIVDFQSLGNDRDADINQWITEDFVKVAEWFNLEERGENRIITEDGEEYGEDEYWSNPGERKKVVDTQYDRRLVCVWRKITGNRVLKEIELPITYIPVIRVPAEYFISKGRRIFRGVVRDARDAVRMVSYTFSSYIESTTVQTKTPYIMAEGQDEGYEQEWQNSNIENTAVLHYRPVSFDGTPSPAPQRVPPPMASQGIIQGLVLSQQALKDVTGMGAASLGQKGNETSGRAILARQKEGDVGQYHIQDNLSKAMRYMGRIIVQWIPHVYDERTVARILGEDGESRMVELTQNPNAPAVTKIPYQTQTGEQKIRRIYNLGVGCYDVVATVGPSYSTKRVETSEMMSQIFQAAPQMIPILGDIFLANQDGPGFDRMAKRLKAMLPPQVAQVDSEGDQSQEEIPPRVAAQLQDMQSKLQEAAQIIQGLQGERERLEAENASKQGEIQAKLAATQAGVDEEKIKSAAQIYMTQMKIDSDEKIAGLQSRVEHMSSIFQLLMKQFEGTGASSPGSESETMQ